MVERGLVERRLVDGGSYRQLANESSGLRWVMTGGFERGTVISLADLHHRTRPRQDHRRLAQACHPIFQFRCPAPPAVLLCMATIKPACPLSMPNFDLSILIFQPKPEVFLPNDHQTHTSHNFTVSNLLR